MMLKRLVRLAVFVVAMIPISISAKSAKPANYIYSEDGVYYYAAAITRQQRENGIIANDAIGYRYYGKNSHGEFVLVRVSGADSIQEFIYCKMPCRVIRTGSGSRFVNNSRLLVSLAFSDAFRGVLRNTDPYAPKPRPRNAVSIPSRSPLEVNIVAESISKTSNGIAIRAAVNAPVYATADGVVVFAGRLEGYGIAIRLGHGGDIQTLYGNLSRMTVSSKEIVTKGQIIGFVGLPANEGNPTLIYEVRIAGTAVDPLPYVAKDDAEWRGLFQTWQRLDGKQ